MAEINFFELWGKESPETMQAFIDFAGKIQGTCGLDEKTFQLVYIGIQASRGGIGSVEAHAGFAKKAGATKKEVLGAVFTSLMTSGINGVSDCIAAAVRGYESTII